MKTNKDLIIERFHQVKQLGFVPSNRCHNTGIGKTFEDYIGVVENNIDEPDLLGFEIKSHRELATSYVTLFTKSPIFPQRANSYLKDRYGVPYPENAELKRFHVSMFASKYTLAYGVYNFRLINDRDNSVIRIGVFDSADNRLIDDSVGYTYDCLGKILKKKLKNLFYVNAETASIDMKEHFHFNRAEIFTNPTLEKFLKLIDEGVIMYDIRIGSYKSGRNYGKAHDHGSGFRILERNLHLLFENHENIE